MSGCFPLRALFVSAMIVPALGAGSLLVSPALTLAAPSHAGVRAANAKSVSLRLPDVLHVLGKGIAQGDARYSKPTAMGLCTSTPPATEYSVNFAGPLRTKGVLTVISSVYTYKGSGGPSCHQKYEISTDKLAGAALGEKLTMVHGVGEQAFILDTTGPKSSLPPVYTLGLNFIRGSYRAVIIVQSNKPIRSTDMIRLGAIVDGRMQHAR